MRGHLVRLTRVDLIEAGMGGLGRALCAIEKGWKRSGPAARLFGDHVLGAIGEVAVCRAFGLTWDATVGRLDAPDAGRYQVRTTYKPNGPLTLRGKDVYSPDVFILVTPVEPAEGTLDGFDYVIRGWLLGRDGNKSKWLCETDNRPGVSHHVPAYFVPQAALHPIGELLKLPERLHRVQRVQRVQEVG